MITDIHLPRRTRIRTATFPFRSRLSACPRVEAPHPRRRCSHSPGAAVSYARRRDPRRCVAQLPSRADRASRCSLRPLTGTLGVRLRGSTLREFRFAVGSRDGPRSTVWKCWVQGAEAYIAGRLFGSEAKISLHSTGECQWSCTDTWVRRDPNRRNADRHIAKWKVVYPQDNTALLAFRVAIPLSELRTDAVQPGQKRAFWVGNAPAGSTVEFCFYFTRELHGPPATDSNPALRHVASLRLRDGRWLVTFVWLRSLLAVDVTAARDAAVTQACEAGVLVRPEHRIALFALPTADTSAAVLEVRATDA